MSGADRKSEKASSKFSPLLGGLSGAKLLKPQMFPLVPPVLREVGKLAAGVASVSTSNSSSGSATETFQQSDKLKNKNKGHLFANSSQMLSNVVEAAKATFYHPEVRKLIDSQTTYDAVIIDEFMNACHHVFAHIFRGHLIILSTMGPNPMVNIKVGNPSQVTTIPSQLDNYSESPNQMDFLGRIKNVLFHLQFYYVTEHILFPSHDKAIKETFPLAPNLDVLYHNVSLILLNSHVSFDKAAPTVPNMIEIGGFHVPKPKPLPNDIRSYLDDAREEGVVYFSLGSSIKSKDLPDDKRTILINVFKSLKQKVLWKFESDLPDKPTNVLIKRWLPQTDILGHQNVKLFITQGGLLSIIEATHSGVPVLAIPIFSDQVGNANRAVSDGIGLKLDYFDGNFTERNLRAIVEELLSNPKYKENVLEKSKLLRDRPIGPMETAVYWVEYVVRHNGAKHLRVAGLGMPWYKYFMVDVIAVLLGVIFLLVKIVLYVSKRLLSKMKSSKVKKH